MWPFKAKPAKKENDWFGDQMKDLKAFREIGQTFNYLGRTCIVTSHTDYIAMAGVFPRLMCDYVDDHGVIRHVSFRSSELPGLVAQNRSE